MSVAGLVLAAGQGRRFGGPKAPYVWRGERLVDRAVRVLGEGGCDRVAVVLGAWVGEVAGARVVLNPAWAEGMGSSLRAGLAAIADGEWADVEAVAVTLVDLPGLTGPAVARVLHEADAGSLAMAMYDGVRGHPVLIGRTHWAGVAASSVGDRGARDYLRQHPVRLVEVGDVADGTDLDVHP